MSARRCSSRSVCYTLAMLIGAAAALPASAAPRKTARPPPTPVTGAAVEPSAPGQPQVDDGLRAVFIQSSAFIDANCQRTIPFDIVALVGSELRRDILLARDLRHEDPEAYLKLQLADFDPEKPLPLRDAKKILATLQKLRMKEMLTVHVSCAVYDGARSGTQAMLKILRYDLDAMDAVIRRMSESDEKTVVLSPRDGSHDSFYDVSRAMEPLPADVRDVAALRLVVRDLLSRLYHVPAVTVRVPQESFLPGAIVTLPVLLQKNDGTTQRSQGSPAPPRGYTANRRVVALRDEQVAREICGDPELAWEELSGEIDELESGDVKARRGLIPEVQTVSLLSASDSWRRGQAMNSSKLDRHHQVRFKAQPYELDYLVRVTVTAEEVDKTGRVRRIESFPSFTCVKVRMPRLWLGLSVRLLAISTDAAHGVSGPFKPDDPTYPAAALTPGFGIDATLMRTFRNRRRRAAPFIRLGGALGFTFFGGRYPCGARRTSHCLALSDDLLPYYNATILYAIDLRFLTDVDFVRFGKFGFGLVSEVGASLNYLKSDPSSFADGAHPALVVNLAPAFNVLTSGREGRMLLRASLGVGYGQRILFPFPTRDRDGFTESAGIPPIVHSLLLFYRAEWAVGQRSSNTSGGAASSRPRSSPNAGSLE